MIVDKKSMAPTVIVGGDEPEQGGEYDEGLIAAAEDMLSAIESKDAEGLKMALHAFYEMCDEMPHEEGDSLPEEGM